MSTKVSEARTAESRGRAFTAFERWTEIPMLFLSLAIIPLLIVPLVVDLSSSTKDAFLFADWAIWGVFAIELLAKTYLAPSRTGYLKCHWFDVLIVVLPFLRPLRVVRSTRSLRVLRFARVGAVGSRSVHSARAVLDEHGLKHVLLAGIVLAVACAGLVTGFERNSDGSIKNFGDGLWWAITTITTVGYGDKFPVTPEGRGIAVFLMLIGITLFSMLTANVAAFLVKPRSEASLNDVLAKLDQLEAEIRALARPEERGR